MNLIKQFPHCDAKVLHAPGECEYCDMHPEWQGLREMWGIAFTGHSHEVIKWTDWEGKACEKILIPCPSELDRPLGIIEKWPGNRSKPKST